MNSRSLKVAIVSLLGALASFVACGESKKKPAAPVEAAAGHGGEASGQAGGAPEGFDPVRCGSETCNAIGSVPPCCADPLEGICGVELGVAVEGLPATTCQPLTQSGKPDPGCPASMARVVAGLPLPAFPGCCREDTGQCGYLVSDVGGLLPFAPGCIDAAPFLDGEEAEVCGPGANQGGAPGAGGSPSLEGGATSGGTPSGEGGSGGYGGVPGGAAGEAGAPVAPGSAGEGGSGGN